VVQWKTNNPIRQTLRKRVRLILDVEAPPETLNGRYQSHGCREHVNDISAKKNKHQISHGPLERGNTPRFTLSLLPMVTSKIVLMAASVKVYTNTIINNGVTVSQEVT
jgi:hypothetical protein